jgi:hypothetical protein
MTPLISTHTIQYSLGSDPGPFILARYGVYVQEIDAWIIFLVFHGNDLHTGFEPITNKLTEEQLDHLDQAYNMAGEPNRINIISYPSWAAASRVGKVAVSPSPHFGNEGAIAPYKA